MANKSNNKRNIVKRNVKSSVFTHLFSISKYKKELYVSLHPKDKDIDVKDIKTYTLSSIFTNIQINDLGLLVKDTLLVLVEAQSTWTLNILPRMIEYIGESFNRYVLETNQNIYGTKKVDLPKPELYVLYTGIKTIKDKSISFKKEFFNSKCPIDVKVNVITLNNSSKVVKEYIRFAKILDTNTKKYGYTKKSINETIDYCIEKNILREYLLEYKKEVYNIMTSVYDQKTATEMYERSLRAEGIEQGMQQGIQQGSISIVLNMFKQKLIDIATATKALNMTESEFLKLV